MHSGEHGRFDLMHLQVMHATLHQHNKFLHALDTSRVVIQTGTQVNVPGSFIQP